MRRFVAAILLASLTSCGELAADTHRQGGAVHSTPPGHPATLKIVQVVVAHGRPSWLPSGEAAAVSGSTVAFATAGSGSCPEVPVSVSRHNRELVFQLRPGGKSVCSSDFASTFIRARLNAEAFDDAASRHQLVLIYPGGAKQRITVAG